VRRTIIAVTCALTLLPVQSHSASRESFDLRDAQDLADLCAVPDGDPMMEAARAFCYGYLSGAGHYHRATLPTAREKPLVCLPEAEAMPSRAEVAKQFVDWGNSHPEYMKEPAIDALFRFATATWPCPEKSQ
jgi:hypothetical protein